MCYYFRYCFIPGYNLLASFTTWWEETYGWTIVHPINNCLIHFINKFAVEYCACQKKYFQLKSCMVSCYGNSKWRSRHHMRRWKISKIIVPDSCFNFLLEAVGFLFGKPILSVVFWKTLFAREGFLWTQAIWLTRSLSEPGVPVFS